MQKKYRDELSMDLCRVIKKYYGKNVTGFYQINHENNQDFEITCVVYRSFLLRFSVGDIERGDLYIGGILGIDVGIGSTYEGLELLVPEKDDDIELDLSEKSIIKNLKILDEYLQWRMTDAQKKTFGLLKKRWI